MTGEFKQIDDVCVKRLQAHDFAQSKSSAMKRAFMWVTIIALLALFLIHCVPVGA